MIGGCYYVVSGQWQGYVTWISLCYALGPTAVLFGKHIDKAEADRAKGIHSLPVILGTSRARKTVIAMLAIQYLLLLTLILRGELYWTALIVLANIPATWRVCRALSAEKPTERPESFSAEVWPLWYAPHAFDHTRRFSAWFVLALLLEIVLVR
jgi:1,4-dihydroxy-2-naphthoate octaprenyltransferase